MSYDIDIERLIDATADEVFDAFTDPDAIAHWFGLDESWIVRTEGSPAAVGAKAGVWFGPADPLSHEERVYTEVDRPHRVAYDETFFGPDGGSFQARLVATFEERDGKTLLRVVQTVPLEEVRDRHAQGWPHFLARLGDVVAARKAA